MNGALLGRLHTRMLHLATVHSTLAEPCGHVLAAVSCLQTNVGGVMPSNVGSSQSNQWLILCGLLLWLVLQDLFYITILAALMGYTEPRKELARAKPVGRVLSLPLVLSLLLQIAVIIVFQVGAGSDCVEFKLYVASR
jgi:hypothetical protein